MQKARWWSEEALKIPEKRKDAKGKVEYSLNAEFQRISRRDKKPFLSAKNTGKQQNGKD